MKYDDRSMPPPGEGEAEAGERACSMFECDEVRERRLGRRESEGMRGRGVMVCMYVFDARRALKVLGAVGGGEMAG